ncbi:hypothetical protein ACFXHA_32770 [Nocardia sp. NPDC059240]|uniref:hypothetical protein n=1 Tax=Nocardia sp. NPDC059240 TaxID=3346786 RepID=UPI00367F88DF
MLSNRMLAAVLLVDATVDAARDAATAEHDRRRAEAEQQIRNQQQEEDRRRRRILTQSGQLALAAVAAAFATALFGAMCAAFSPNIAHTVWFAAADVHKVTMGNFVGLWIYISITLLFAVVVLAVLGSVLPYPFQSEVVSTSARWGFGIGIVLFLIQAVQGAGAGVWWLPAVFAVFGHAGYGLVRRAREDG